VSSHAPSATPTFVKYRWKKAKDSEGDVIISLLYPAHAKRSNAGGRKCRGSEAVDTGHYRIGSNEMLPDNHVAWSDYDRSFTYQKGMTVKPTEPFDEDRWNECSTGIHFFITRIEAEDYD